MPPTSARPSPATITTCAASEGVVPLRWLWLAVFVLAVAALAYGIHLGQVRDVATHASNLCLDCIGLSGH